MKTQLESKGYKVAQVISTGNWIATKGSRSYQAESLQALFDRILG